MKVQQIGFLLALTCFISLTACAPKVYVIDRQTILEDQAAGKWPELDKTMLKRSKAEGPTPLSKVPMNERRARLYNVLNSELGL
jgi:hypothetical protein